ncbi:MAG: glycosyltransferase family 9 protein [Planctomycetes bacterium]|nr:glycosyltransferase family 9 protein [Planctomycetota bacterium]
MAIEETREAIRREVGEIRRLLIVRLSAFGDIVHSMHAAAGLKAAAPHIEIGWLTDIRYEELVRCAPFVNWVHGVDGSNGLIHAIGSCISVKKKLRGLYDITVDVQGLLKSAVAAARAGTGVLGYAGPESREGSGLFYRWRVEPDGSASHVVDKQARLLSAVVPVVPARKLALAAPAAVVRNLEDRYPWIAETSHVLLHTKTRWPSKDIPQEITGPIADILAGYGARLVVTAQNESDAESLRRTLGARNVTVVAGLALAELVHVFSTAGLFVGPDTGPTHLASALGVPTVALYGPTDPARNAPYGPATVSIRPYGNACAPCWKKNCARGTGPAGACLSAVTPEDIESAVKEVLSGKDPTRCAG